MFSCITTIQLWPPPCLVSNEFIGWDPSPRLPVSITLRSLKTDRDDPRCNSLIRPASGNLSRSEIHSLTQRRMSASYVLTNVANLANKFCNNKTQSPKTVTASYMSTERNSGDLQWVEDPSRHPLDNNISRPSLAYLPGEMCMICLYTQAANLRIGTSQQMSASASRVACH